MLAILWFNIFSQDFLIDNCENFEGDEKISTFWLYAYFLMKILCEACEAEFYSLYKLNLTYLQHSQPMYLYFVEING